MEVNYDSKLWSKSCPKYDCKKSHCECGLQYVNISATLGDDSAESKVAPKNGTYCNAIVKYEANGNIYMYSEEGVPVLINGVTCDCPEEKIINLSVVFDSNSWEQPQKDYSVIFGDSGRIIIGTASLTPAQGNQGLFVNDDTGEFVTIEQAYKLIELGNKVRFNHVPVGQFLREEGGSDSQPDDCCDGIVLDTKHAFNVDGAPVTSYSGTVFKPGPWFPPLGVYIQKIDQDDPLEDTYEFFVQGEVVTVP